MQPPRSTPARLALRDRAMVAVWRHGVMPLGAALGGVSAPALRTSERRYGPLPDEVMDVVEPTSTAPRLPVVFIHGGGWICGSKGRFYNRPLVELADAGHPVFSLNYPLAPESPHPQALRSLLSALALLRREHGVDAVHLMGDSAGGNLAIMLGLLLASGRGSNPELLRAVAGSTHDSLPRVSSTVSLYGVLDRCSWIEDGFPGARLFLTAYAGKDALDASYSPPIPVTPMDATFVTNVPPTFLGAGTKDKLARSSRIYAEQLESRAALVSHKTYEGANHGFYCFPGAQGDALRQDVLQFLAQVEAATS